MTGVEIRAARPDDLPALVAVFGQEHYFTGRMRRVDAGVVDLLVAWRDGVPVGDVVLIREPVDEPEIRAQQPDVPQISHLEVAEAHRRQGIATALLDAAEALALQHGHGTVLLGVGVTNTAARELYDRRGYCDWEHGEVTFRWTYPGPDGERIPDSEQCHVLVKFVDPAVPGLDAWNAWHPREAAALLAGCPVPWAVAGGWAIDLHLGRRTREHSDLEIAIPRGQFRAFRPYLSGFDLYEAGSGRVRRLGPEDEPGPANHQVWLAEPALPAWRMDTFLEPGDEQVWVSHRDGRVTMPMARAVRRDPAGIPYLAPELVLFAKAKHAREKDRGDLANALPTLDADARAWFGWALGVAHPGHAWLERLSG